MDQNQVSKQHMFKMQARVCAVYAVLLELPIQIRNLNWFQLSLEQQLYKHTMALEVWLAYTEPLVVQQGQKKMALALNTGTGT
jgi:hypothetical protein